MTALNSLGREIPSSDSGPRTSFRQWQGRQASESATREDSVEASSGQARLWLLDQLDPGSAAYHCVHTLRATGHFPLAAIEFSLQTLAERHTALRARFETSESGVLQRHVSPHRPFRLQVIDVSNLVAPEERAIEIIRREGQRPFDIARGPLWRACAIRLAEGCHWIAFMAHHIILDDWTVGLLLREMDGVLESCARSVPVHRQNASAMPRASHDSMTVAASRRYWVEALAGVPVLKLPTEQARPARRRHRGSKAFVRIDAHTVAAIRRQALHRETTPFAVALAGFRALLAAWSGQTDFAIGTPVLNRRGCSEEKLIGLLANLIALRTPVTRDLNFWELVRAETEIEIEALQHQSTPFEEVVELVNPPRSLGLDPLFQVMFVYHQRTNSTLHADGARFEPIDVALPVSRLEMTLMAVELEDELSISLEYDRDLFSEPTIERFLSDYVRILRRAGSDEKVKMSELLADRSLVSVEPALPTSGPSIVLRLERQVQATPDRIAVRNGMDCRSYRWLWRRAMAFRDWFCSAGVSTESVIAILLPRSIDQVAATLGTLLAGAAFAPFDPEVPQSRTREMLRRLAPRIIVGSRAHPPPSDLGAVLLHVEALVALPNARDERRFVAPRVTGDSMAYVIHTSGSTGVPKGVMGLHGGLENRLDWLNVAYPFAAGDVALCRARPTFVDSICEFLAPLLAGCPISILDDADAAGLSGVILRDQVTRMTLPPTALRTLLDMAEGGMQETSVALAQMELLVSSGEALLVRDVERLRAAAPSTRLLNLYGSSEVTADALHHLASEQEVAHSVCLGVPIARTVVRLRGAWDGPAVVGGLGEIGIGGAPLARGYVADPAGTAERFAPDPLGAPGGPRVYWTGDIARVDVEGRLFFAGRRDRQVSVRGVRVELDEVEIALRGDSQIEAAAVQAAASPERIVAWLVLRGARLDEAALRSRLSQRMPRHLIPDQFVELPALPLNRSGKTDYPALSVPAESNPHETQPRTGLEAEVMLIWRRVLHIGAIDRNASFFALGGHSFAAARVAQQLSRQLGREVPLALVFQRPILCDFAASLAESTEVEAPGAICLSITPEPERRYDVFPLTDMQRAYVLGRGTSFDSGGVSIHGYAEVDWERLDIDQFEHALHRLISRHDMLRAVLVSDTEQRVLATVPEFAVQRIDLRSVAPAVADATMAGLRKEMASQVLDLRRWPAFDIRASLRKDHPPRLHVSFDSTFVDAWSQELLLRELVAMIGGAASPPPVEVSFRDYAAALRVVRSSDLHSKALSDWRTRLSLLPDAPTLPLAKASGPLRVFKVSSKLSSELGTRLAEKAIATGVSLTDTLLGAFALMLAEWSSSPHFTLNVPTHGRALCDAPVERMVGPFGDFSYAAFDLRQGPTFDVIVRAARAELNWILDHQVVCGMQLAHELMSRRGFQLLTPIVFTSLNFGDAATGAPPSDAFREVYSTSQTPQVWLDCRVRIEVGHAVRIDWDVAGNVFPVGLAERMMAFYVSLLTDAASKDWSAIPGPPVPTTQPAEPPHPFAGPLGERFWHWREQQRDAPALVGTFGEISYGTLGDIAEGVAAWLSERGIGVGHVVAVVMDKGWEQVAALLGVARTGAVFAPLDLEQPSARLQELLQSLSVVAILTRAGQACASPWPDGVPVLGISVETRAHRALPPPPRVAASDLAYIIHTSGSSGRPKGVMISHAGAWNTIAEINARFGLRPSDRVMAVSALTFDLAIWDVFGTLSAGAALLMPSGSGARDPAVWIDIATRCGMTVWNSAPALMGILLERLAIRGTGGVALSRLRLALLSGDWIPLSMPTAIKAYAPECEVVSLGGATEVSIWSVAHVVDRVDPEWPSIPYGRPLRGQTAHVLDGRMRLRAPWAEGELHIGGAGVALGYWGDPSLTSERFVDHPQTRERLYRTGDLARYLPNGELQLLGRMDRQVKINGRRIEPGEVEAALAGCEGISRAAVTPFRDRGGAVRLAAHLVRSPNPLPERSEAQPRAKVLEKLALSVRQPGRRTRGGSERLSLQALPRPEQHELVLKRRSRRVFARIVIERSRFAGLLSVLAEIEVPGSIFPKRRYASAGNLYPVQIYVLVRPGAVLGVRAGFYCFDPQRGDLERLAEWDDGDGDLGVGGNQALVAAASFVLLLVNDAAAIEGAYSSDALRFATLESGAIAQLLETEAFDLGLGLCQLGDVNRARVTERCALGPSSIVLHALAGGPVSSNVDLSAGFLDDSIGWQQEAVASAEWLAERACEVKVRDRLAACLPSYLEPKKFIFWPEFPVTSNGKIDLRALAERATAEVECIREAPVPVPTPPSPALPASDDVLTPLREIWCSILDVERVTEDDSFLALGGTSLQALRLMSEIEREFGVAPSIMIFLQSPTLALLAERIREMGGVRQHADSVGALSVKPDMAQRAEPFPLSSMQQAYVVGGAAAWKLGSGRARYYFELDFLQLDVPRLQRAMRRLISRHEMLRVVLLPPFQQRILPDTMDYQIPVETLLDVSVEYGEGRLLAIREDLSEGARPLDTWPPFGAMIVELSGGRSRLLLALELFIADAHSIQLLTIDLLLLYEKDADGALPALEFSFRDHLLRERELRAGPDGKRDKLYWLERLDRLPAAPLLPVRDVSGVNPPSAFRRLSRGLDKETFAAFKRTAAQYGATASGALCAAFSTILAQWASEPRFTLNLSTDNRWPFHPDVPLIVGDFTASTLLEVDVRVANFGELARNTQYRLLMDLRHRLFSGVEVIRELNRRAGSVGAYLTPVVFTSVLNGAGLVTPKIKGLQSELVYAVSQTPQVALDHQVFEVEGALFYNWDFSESIYPEGLIDEMFDVYDAFIHRLAREAGAWTEPF
jgi:amino acid adenylation domain-containing protein